jgi:sterol desaturase/sphingolipid hydroxylase (fatty acid hydroxylase superfamily)
VHRWHHSRRIAESNNNYAHSFVVWDLLFGTYFRPRDRAVDELGLLARDYPRRFLAQLSAPFARGAP